MSCARACNLWLEQFHVAIYLVRVITSSLEEEGYSPTILFFWNKRNASSQAALAIISGKNNTKWISCCVNIGFTSLGSVVQLCNCAADILRHRLSDFLWSRLLQLDLTTPSVSYPIPSHCCLTHKWQIPFRRLANVGASHHPWSIPPPPIRCLWAHKGLLGGLNK